MHDNKDEFAEHRELIHVWKPWPRIVINTSKLADAVHIFTLALIAQICVLILIIVIAAVILL